MRRPSALIQTATRLLRRAPKRGKLAASTGFFAIACCFRVPAREPLIASVEGSRTRERAKVPFCAWHLAEGARTYASKPCADHRAPYVIYRNVIYSHGTKAGFRRPSSRFDRGGVRLRHRRIGVGAAEDVAVPEGGGAVLLGCGPRR